MAGILDNLRALTIFLASANISYERLKPHMFCGAYTFWGKEHRDAPIKLP